MTLNLQCIFSVLISLSVCLPLPQKTSWHILLSPPTSNTSISFFSLRYWSWFYCTREIELIWKSFHILHQKSINCFASVLLYYFLSCYNRQVVIVSAWYSGFHPLSSTWGSPPTVWSFHSAISFSFVSLSWTYKCAVISLTLLTFLFFCLNIPLQWLTYFSAPFTRQTPKNVV